MCLVEQWNRHVSWYQIDTIQYQGTVSKIDVNWEYWYIVKVLDQYNYCSLNKDSNKSGTVSIAENFGTCIIWFLGRSKSV